MRVTPMPALVLIAATALLSSPAFSQGVQPTPSATPAEPGFAKEMIPQAPIGHRQPTLRDIPKDENADIDARDKTDQGFDRVLEICRGC